MLEFLPGFGLFSDSLHNVGQIGDNLDDLLFVHNFACESLGRVDLQLAQVGGCEGPLSKYFL